MAAGSGGCGGYGGSKAKAASTAAASSGGMVIKTVTVHETAFFDGDQWIRSVVHFDFSGVYTGPTGKTYTNETHQNATFTPYFCSKTLASAPMSSAWPEV